MPRLQQRSTSKTDMRAHQGKHRGGQFVRAWPFGGGHGHDLQEIAAQDRTLTSGALHPMQHGAAGEMTTAANERQSAAQRQRFRRRLTLADRRDVPPVPTRAPAQRFDDGHQREREQRGEEDGGNAAHGG